MCTSSVTIGVISNSKTYKWTKIKSQQKSNRTNKGQRLLTWGRRKKCGGLTCTVIYQTSPYTSSLCKDKTLINTHSKTQLQNDKDFKCKDPMSESILIPKYTIFNDLTTVSYLYPLWKGLFGLVSFLGECRNLCLVCLNIMYC